MDIIDDFEFQPLFPRGTIFRLSIFYCFIDCFIDRVYIFQLIC